MKKRWLFPLILVFILSGCQSEKQPAGKKEKAAPAAPQETKVEKVSSQTTEELIDQTNGEIYEKHIPSDDNQNAARSASEDAADEYLDHIKKEDTGDWDAERWAASITENLRTGYKEKAGDLKNYEVVFDEIKLPDGRLLQDVDLEELTEEQKEVNIALLIDSSGSMKAEVDGESKMELAKESLENFAGELPEGAHVSLIAFGHKGTGSDSDKEMSCKAVESFYPMEEYDKGKFASALDGFDPKGWTPLAESILLANDQFPKDAQNFIYVVSDGIETCDGDPVEAAKKVKEDNTDVQVNIIGFDVDSKADDQLKNVARAGGGEYTSVKTKQELKDIETSWKDSISEGTWIWWKSGNFSNNIWTSVDHYNNLRDLYSSYLTMRNLEHDRFLDAVNALVDDELIDLDKKQEILTILDERNQKIKDYMSGLESDKKDEIEETSDDLKKKVDEIEKKFRD
ncbi:vWA domain-containing protein [Rossellomorea marisflavi]|uniref:vWA domain-containing protein n=1 Tax=Rossellomorea marisflavi TaxID=189381 RepID=UPI003FA0D6FD